MYAAKHGIALSRHVVFAALSGLSPGLLSAPKFFFCGFGVIRIRCVALNAAFSQQQPTMVNTTATTNSKLWSIGCYKVSDNLNSARLPSVFSDSLVLAPMLRQGLFLLIVV